MIDIQFPEQATATIVQRVDQDSFEVDSSLFAGAEEMRALYCRYPNTHYGSSTGIEDTRKIGDYTFERALRERILEIQYRLGLNKTQLADIFRVSRPTLYEWLEGGVPQPDNQTRIESVEELLQALPAGARLNARFVRKARKEGKSMIDLLSEEHFDGTTVKGVFEQVVAENDAERSANQSRELLRRQQGFEDVPSEQQDTNLKTNIAKLDWPG